jgi:hypothetical protein
VEEDEEEVAIGLDMCVLGIGAVLMPDVKLRGFKDEFSALRTRTFPGINA